MNDTTKNALKSVQRHRDGEPPKKVLMKSARKAARKSARLAAAFHDIYMYDLPASQNEVDETGVASYDNGEFYK